MRAHITNNTNVEEKRAGGSIKTFLATFGLLLVFFYGISYYPAVEESWLPAYRALQARVSGTLLGWAGYDVVVAKGIIAAPEFRVAVKRGCDGLAPLGLFLAAVLAHSASWRRKMQGLAAGVSILYGLNVFRISSLFLIGIYVPDYFHFFHVDAWQAAYILFATGLWVWWARK